jgi:hypothetical protein
MFHTVGYIDARVVVKAIDSSIVDRGIGWKVLCTIFIITGQLIWNHIWMISLTINENIKQVVV